MRLILDAGSLSTALTALVAFGVAMYRFVIRPSVARLRALHDLVTRELAPNGGSSLRDALDRVEQLVADHVADHTAHPRRREEDRRET